MSLPSPSQPLPDCFLPTEGVFNFRDVGGLATLDGHRIRTGVLLRSDNWKHATASDLEYAHGEAKIRHIVDLRREAERRDHGVFPASGIQTLHHLELVHLPWQRFDFTDADPVSESEKRRFLAQRYASMLESGWEGVRDSLNVIADGETTLVHCMAGKDRTGIVVAVALALAGVSDEDIAADYELTTFGTRRWKAFRDAKYGPPRHDRVKPSRAECMIEAFQLVRERFRSMETYAKVIGFERVEDLREALVE
ncbi:tyrosine-protein phosphatase [Salininema proteolyticum]|uniref:Tyrosine-protein phosphatase n=1 Tax=Salininema proteolyticum TaxID=1607685 RepID=A0ABV8TWC1_9ACTN